MPEFYMILARKIIKIPEFFMIFARKIYKIPEFYMIFARKMPEFYIIIARKIFSRILGGHVPLLPPPPSPRLWSLSWTPQRSRPAGKYGEQRRRQRRRSWILAVDLARLSTPDSQHTVTHAADLWTARNYCTSGCSDIILTKTTRPPRVQTLDDIFGGRVGRRMKFAVNLWAYTT